jgi:hypothetical protein
MSKYVDISGDIQTVSWIGIRYMPSEVVATNEDPQNWITSYRTLLGSWSLNHVRADFDNACHAMGAYKQPLQQV